MAYIRVPVSTMDEFLLNAFTKFGFSAQQARVIADVLLLSDLYGIESHGVQRLVLYHKAIEKGQIEVKAQPEVVFETPVSAVIDGHFGMGQLNAHFGMKLAIEKAKKTGIGMVSIRDSNHFGIAGYYAKLACDEGFLGFGATNSEAIMVPTFGSKAILGSNPIAFAMPAEPYDFFFDVSTTVVTRGKVEVYNKKQEPLPDGWTLGKDGLPTQDSSEVLRNLNGRLGGGILPVGGDSEVTGGHKGYGFGMLCEIFCSILSQGATSNHLLDGHRYLTCHGVAAIDPAIFGDPKAIKQGLSTLLEELRQSPKAEGQQRIYTHGEKEIIALADRRENGIPVNENTMREIFDACDYLSIDPTEYFGDYRPSESGVDSFYK